MIRIRIQGQTFLKDISYCMEIDSSVKDFCKKRNCSLSNVHYLSNVNKEKGIWKFPKN